MLTGLASPWRDDPLPGVVREGSSGLRPPAGRSGGRRRDHRTARSGARSGAGVSVLAGTGADEGALPRARARDLVRATDLRATDSGESVAPLARGRRRGRGAASRWSSRRRAAVLEDDSGPEGDTKMTKATRCRALSPSSSSLSSSRRQTELLAPHLRAPRACGGDPGLLAGQPDHVWCSPRMRG